MKLLTQDEIVELVAPSDESSALARKNFGIIADALNDDLDSFFSNVKKGFFKQTEIQANGKPVYMIFWHETDQGGLHVNGAVSLDKEHDNFNCLMIGINFLAKKIEAKAIEFHTARRGLIKKVNNWGFRVEAVQVFKRIEA